MSEPDALASDGRDKYQEKTILFDLFDFIYVSSISVNTL